MDDKRLELNSILEEILGSENVYFQPPENLKLHYPCIIYNFDYYDARRANNELYLSKKRYSLTYVDRDPDSDIPDKLLALPLCSFDRFYTSSNLNHYVFTIFY